MDEKKTLDLDGIEKDAADAETRAKAYGPDHAPSGPFEFKLQKPIVWRGQGIEHHIDTLHFDYDKITGGVIAKAENAYFQNTGRQVIQTAFNNGFHAYIAALACTDRDELGRPFVSVETIEALGAADFRALMEKFNRFFVAVETAAMRSAKSV